MNKTYKFKDQVDDLDDFAAKDDMEYDSDHLARADRTAAAQYNDVKELKKAIY